VPGASQGTAGAGNSLGGIYRYGLYEALILNACAEPWRENRGVLAVKFKLNYKKEVTVTDISKEFSELKLAINMGYTRGRQKAIEIAFDQLEEVILNTQPERPWWKFWDRHKLEV